MGTHDVAVEVVLRAGLGLEGVGPLGQIRAL
jgi:hypothetical protein